ncbi:MAG: hypothetical protein C4530_10150 [Desulfobacteraceae bacterium]|nr:MAG: hypothetical protein C4530_10150 [Desulfobacteraceae bacterium]
MTPTEIQKAGWKALREKLGLVGALRFVLQYEKGQGDYTRLRRDLFKDETVEALVKDMKRRPTSGTSSE